MLPSVVSCRCSVPSRFIEKICWLPVRFDEKTMCIPLGDQLGLSLSPLPVVSGLT